MFNRPLNISEISKIGSVRDAFMMLGPMTSEVIVKQSDIQHKNDRRNSIEEIVRLIGKGCSRDYLKKLTIVFDLNGDDENEFRTAIPDAMLAIESMTIEGVSRSKLINCKAFLQAFSKFDLQSITLKNMEFPQICLQQLNFNGLCELTMIDCGGFGTCTSYWENFFAKSIPSLKSFTCINCNLTSPNAFDFAKAFPALKQFHFGPFFIEISKLPKLQHLCIESPFIFGDKALKLMKSVAEIGSVEELEIDRRYNFHVEANKAAKSAMPKVMERLKKLCSLKIHNGARDWTNVVILVKKIPQLATIHLIGEKPIPRHAIRAFIEMEEVRTIKLDVPLPNFNAELYDSLVQYHTEWHYDSPSIDIYMSQALLDGLKPQIANYSTKSNRIQLLQLQTE